MTLKTFSNYTRTCLYLILNFNSLKNWTYWRVAKLKRRLRPKTRMCTHEHKSLISITAAQDFYCLMGVSKRICLVLLNLSGGATWLCPQDPFKKGKKLFLFVFTECSKQETAVWFPLFPLLSAIAHYTPKNIFPLLLTASTISRRVFWSE